MALNTRIKNRKLLFENSDLQQMPKLDGFVFADRFNNEVPLITVHAGYYNLTNAQKFDVLFRLAQFIDQEKIDIVKSLTVKGAPWDATQRKQEKPG